MERYECSRSGTVVVVWPQVGLVRLLGYADLPPRFVGIIRLDDGTHIEAEIVDVTETQVNEHGPGMRVRMVFRKIRRESNGNWCYGYKFTPGEEEEYPRPLNPAERPLIDGKGEQI